MKEIELRDLKNHVFLTLREVLAALPARAIFSTFWSVSEFADVNGEWFEVASNGDDHISELERSGARILGKELAAIATTAPQVIWATFRGYDTARASEPWIVLHAIDSHYWRCETSDVPTRQALMRSFKDVRLVPQ